jgi:hypothetical protein
MGSPILFEREELMLACPLCGISMPGIAYVKGGEVVRSVSSAKPY